jgi:hypothetical protein
MGAPPTQVRAVPRHRPLDRVAWRYRRTTWSIFLAGAIWIPVSRAASLPIVFSLAPPMILLALSPLSVHRWWPGMALAVRNRWVQAKGWTEATHEPYSRAGAQRWLDGHPEPSLRRLSALGLVRSYEEAGRLLDSLHPDSPVERWQLEYSRASYSMAVGLEPDLPAVEASWSEVDMGDYPLPSRRNGAIQMALLRAQNEARLGGNGADSLTEAARSIGLEPPTPRLQLTIWWYRYRGPAPFMCFLLLLWAL